MPSAALYAIEFTFARGFESYLRSQSFSDFEKIAKNLDQMPSRKFGKE